MTLRKAHGAGKAALVRVETSPVDELPEGIPDEARQEIPTDRGERGRFSRANSLAARGGKMKAGKTRLATKLGLSKLSDDSAFRPYKASAETFRRVQCANLAITVGGGFCGPGPSSIVASAALALAWSRFFSDQAALTGDPELAIRSSALADKSRQSLLTAHELCAREAMARKKAPNPGAWDFLTKVNDDEGQDDDT